MRNKLVISLLFLLGSLAIAAVSFSSFSVQSDADKSKAKHGADTLPINPDRDVIPVLESKTLASRNLLPVGTRSLLKVPARMRHGDFLWNERGVSAGTLNIWVDLRRQTISAFRNGHEIGTALIIYGAEDKNSPEGVFRIIRKVHDYHSRSYDAPMPSSLFITNDGVALHGSPMSARRASHGCIGLPVKFAEKLYAAAKVGDEVNITRSTGPIDPYAVK